MKVPDEDRVPKAFGFRSCVACEQTLPRDQFESRRRVCLKCAPRFKLRVRSKQRHHSAKYQSRKRLELRVWVDLLKDGPCTDCGVKYPSYVMDWDHVRGEKAFNISVARNQYACNIIKELILKEIKKCDLVCANCHRIRTHATQHGPEVVTGG